MRLFNTVKQFIIDVGHEIWEYKNAIKQISDITRRVPLIKQFRLNGIPVELIKDGSMMKVSGVMFSSVVRERYRYVIAVDDHFDKVSSATQQFLIQHEIGHIICKHVAKYSYLNQLYRLAMSLISVDEKELEADNYAADTVGINNAIRALEELYSYRRNKEIAKRIEILKHEREEMLKYTEVYINGVRNKSKITGSNKYKIERC